MEKVQRFFYAPFFLGFMNLQACPGRLWFRVVAALLCLAMPSSELKAFAQTSPSASIPASQNNIPPIELPRDLGIILEEDPGKISPHGATENLVIHIQDAHGQLDAQLKIEAILRHLACRYGFKTIFVEGAFNGIVSKDLLRFFKDNALNNRIAQDLLRLGVIGGAELFFLNSGAACQVTGLEDPALYRKNISAFRKVYAQRRPSRRIFHELDRQIQRISSAVFNPDLRQFFMGWMMLKDDSSARLSRVDTLNRFAKRQIGLDLRDSQNQWKYPQLVRLFKLKDLRENIQNAVSGGKLRIEKENLIHWLEHSDRNLIESDTVRALKALLDENRTDATAGNARFWVERFYAQSHRLGFKFEDYPNIGLLLGTKILQEELAGIGLYDEMRELTGEILGALAKSENERKLLEIFSDYRLLQKLFKLELTRPELDEMLKRQYAAVPSALFERLAVLDQRSALPDVRDMTKSDHFFRDALLFYKLAVDRDRAMFENFMQAFRKNKPDKSILITGGFHKKGLGDRLKEEGFSVLEIQPGISRPDSREKYLASILLRSHSASTLKPVSPGLIPLPLVAQDIGPDDYAFHRAQLIRAIRNAATERETSEIGPAFQAQDLDGAEVIVAGFGFSQEAGRVDKPEAARDPTIPDLEKTPVNVRMTTAQRVVQAVGKIVSRVIILNILLVLTTALPIRLIMLLEGVASVQFQMKLIIAAAGTFLAWAMVKGVESLLPQGKVLKHREFYIMLPVLFLFVPFEISARPTFWLALFTISTITSLGFDARLESKFRGYAVFKRLWPNRAYRIVEKIPFVLLHLFALRFFYVPFFFGILPWNAKVNHAAQVTIFGVEKTRKKSAEITEALKTLPDFMFDEENSEALKHIFFFPWLPESAMWRGGSRFAPIFDNQLIVGSPPSPQGGLDLETLRHEIGHYVLFRPSFKTFLEQWAHFYQVYRRDTNGYNLGDRSLADGYEAFPEWFRQYDRLLAHFDKLDTTAMEMWLVIAQSYVSERQSQASLKILYPGRKTVKDFPVNLDKRGHLTLGELQRVVELAREEMIGNSILKKSLLTPESYLNVRKQLESLKDPEKIEEFAMLGLLIDPKELLDQPEELTDAMIWLLQRPETKRAVKYSAAEFLGKLRSERAVDALGEALFTLAPPPEEPVATRIFPINLRILRVLEKIPREKTTQVLTTALDRLLNGERSLDQSEAIVRVMIARNARTERDRQILDEIIRHHGNDEKFNAGNLARQYLQEVEAALELRGELNNSGFGVTSGDALSIGERLFKRRARWRSLKLLTQKKQDIVYKIISALPVYSQTFLDLDSAESEIYVWTLKRYFKWYALPVIAVFAVLIVAHYAGIVLGIWKTPTFGNVLKNYFSYMTNPNLPLSMRIRYPFTETLKTLFDVWSGTLGRITLILFGVGFLGYWNWLHKKWFPPFRFRRIHIWPYGSDVKFLRRAVAEFERSFGLRHGTLPRSEERLDAVLKRRSEEAGRLPKPGSEAAGGNESARDNAPGPSTKGFGVAAETSTWARVDYPIDWKRIPTFSDRAVAEITGGIFHIEQAAFIEHNGLTPNNGGKVFETLVPLHAETPMYFGYFRNTKIAGREPLRIVLGFENIPGLDDPRIRVITEFLAQNKNAQVLISTAQARRGELLNLNEKLNRKIRTARQSAGIKFSGVGLTVVGPEEGRLDAFIEGKAAKTLVYDSRPDLLETLRSRVKDKDRIFWVENDRAQNALLELEALALLNAIDQLLTAAKPPAGIQKASHLLEFSGNVEIRLRADQIISRAA